MTSACLAECECQLHAGAVMLQQLVVDGAHGAWSEARSGLVLCAAAASTVLAGADDVFGQSCIQRWQYLADELSAWGTAGCCY